MYGQNQSILWSPWKIGTPLNFTIAYFGHPVSKSWLRPWLLMLTANKNTSLTNLMIFCRQSQQWQGNTCGEMAIRTLPKALIQIFLKTILNFQVIVQSIIQQFLEKLSSINGLTLIIHAWSSPLLSVSGSMVLLKITFPN